MVFKIQGDIIIDRPVEEVFDFVVDGRNEPTYNPRMRRAEKITEGPVRAGTRFRAAVTSIGRPVEFVTEITAYDRPRRYGLSTHLSVMDIRGFVTFDPIDDGTRMRWSWDVTPRGAFRLVAPLMALIGRRQEAAIWAGLKHVLEERTHPAVA